ncbi:unnamed protein product [Paramecium sonneborni]|uniref:RING-CH-type domain-containing protein n=1 Tax=Paramecium sonneborni TaxID=65129 RepID=A0A8S1QMC1_9CILI|nr:unnamed protein product [Paramecium sonneborni]
MFIPEALTMSQSPQHQFNTIDQSQQQINQVETIQFGQMLKTRKIVPELKMRKIYLMKDQLREKNVWIEMQINQYRQQDSILHDETKFCRICLCDDGNSDLIRPCKCKGSLQYIHENCLKIWILEKQGIEKVYKNNIDCEVCHSKFLMETKFCDQKKLKMIQRATKARKCCWIIEIIVSFGIIGIIIGLIFLIITSERIDPLVLASALVLFILLILNITFIYASCIDQVKVEVLDPWKIIDIQGESYSQSISILELDNQIKQSIQIVNNNDNRQNRRYSTLNVIQIQN